MFDPNLVPVSQKTKIFPGFYGEFLEIHKYRKKLDGIHLKNICTKFEFNPSILKVSKFGGTDIDRQTEEQRENILHSAYAGV